ncbi:MAG: RibD family protein [Longimicrobiales bacterium]
MPAQPYRTWSLPARAQRQAIDPRATLDAGARIFAPDGARRIMITLEQAPLSTSSDVERITLPRTGALLDPAAILDALSARGLRRVLIEGGARTISHFLAAGCLDRLHVMVAPLILRSGLPPCAYQSTPTWCAMRCCLTATCRLSAYRGAWQKNPDDRP